MATTQKLISSVTVGAGGAATIDFTSIPANYTDLLLKYSLRTNTTAGAGGQIHKITINGTTTSFTYRRLYGSGATVGSDNAANNTIGYNDPSDYTANTFGNGELYIPNYAGATYKSISIDSVDENNATAAEMSIVASLWSNTAAITSIGLVPNAGSWVQYSTAYLYGIKNS